MASAGDRAPGMALRFDETRTNPAWVAGVVAQPAWWPVRNHERADRWWVWATKALHIGAGSAPPA